MWLIAAVAVQLVLVLAAITLFSFVCATAHVPNIGFGRFMRETFSPMTAKEFWFPPCPFCWAARGAAVVLLFFAVTGSYAG